MLLYINNKKCVFFVNRKNLIKFNKIKIDVFNNKHKKIGFCEFEYDYSGNIRNSIYVSVYPGYQNKGIAKAMYDF